MEQNGNDEVIKGEPLREVRVVKVEEEECEGEDEILLGCVRQSAAYQLHPHHSHHKGCTTSRGKEKVRCGNKVVPWMEVMVLVCWCLGEEVGLWSNITGHYTERQ